GPVAVAVEEGAGVVLLGALVVALHADAVEDVEQPDREAGADDPGRALGTGDARVHGPQEHADDDDDRRQPGAREPQDHRMSSGASIVASHGSAAESNIRSAHSRSPGSPTDASSRARTWAGLSPAAARSASVTEPCRLARRVPSGPRISGTWAWVGRGRPRRSYRCSCPGVASTRSAPRTTSPTPWSASSTTTRSEEHTSELQSREN